MSTRFRHIARQVASESIDTTAYPALSGLAALRGDLTALQRELVEEAAHSLGSATRRLEHGFELLRQLEAELSALAATDPGRSELVARFNAQREEVLLRLHYLRIQREALGFTRHTELDRRYPVPAKKT